MEKIHEHLRCRTCLKKTDPAKSKKLTPEMLYDGKLILKMLNFCIPELVIYLVPVICKKCLQSLNSLYKFKTMCLKNDLKFCKGDYHKKYELNDFPKHVPSESDSNIGSTVENNFPHSTTENADLNSDVNQNETFTSPANTNESIVLKKKLVTKKFSYYRKRFTNTYCSGCQNRIRDVKYHTNDLDKNCICFNCGKKFTSMKEIRKHVYTHLYLHKCKICGKKWRDAYHLKLHLRSHSKEKPYECPECEKRFVQSHNLHQHLAIHNGDRNNQNRCEECGKILSTKYNLKIHMTTHNIGSKPRCSNCNKWFYTEAALLKHSEICIIIKKENEIFFTEPEHIKTETYEYLKKEKLSDVDDVFSEETSFQSISNNEQGIINSVKIEESFKLEEHG